MLLKAIEVENFQMFHHRRRVEFDEQAINILHAPNGSGKSTLVAAMLSGFLEDHGTTSQYARRMKPWERDLAPVVIVEFLAGDERYRLEKRFFKSSRAMLERWEKGHYAPWKDSDAAEAELRRILSADLTARNLVKNGSWGIASVLWSVQNQLPLARVDEPVVEQIRSSLGAQAISPATERLEDRAREFYGEYWTRTGLIKKGKEVPTFTLWEEQLAALDQELLQLNNDLARLDQLRNAVAQSRREEQAAKQAADVLGQRLQDAEQQLKALSPLKTQRAELNTKLNEAKTAWESLDLKIKRIDELTKELGDLQKQIADGESKRQLLEIAEQSQAAEVGQCKEALDKLNAQQPQLKAAKDLASAAEQYLAARKAAETVASIEKLRNDAKALGAPSASEIAGLRKLLESEAAVSAQLDAALLHFDITAERDLEVRLTEGDNPGDYPVAAGATLRLSGSPRIAVELAGVGRFVLSGPPASAAELRQKLANVRGDIDSLAAKLGSKDPAALEQRLGQANELLAQAKAFESGLDKSLAVKARAIVQQQESLHPEWGASPPDAAALKQAADQMQQDWQAGYQKANAALNKAFDGLSATQKRLVEAKTALEHHRAAAKKAEADLAVLQGDGKTQDMRRNELSELALLHQGIKAQVEQLDEQLKAFPPGLEQEASKLRQQLEIQDKKYQQAHDELTKSSALLAAGLEAAPYESLAEKEEERAALEARIADERLRADAAKLLWNLAVECKQQYTAGLQAPVQKKAAELLARIAGVEFGGIRLSDSLAPESFEPAAADSPVELEQLSGGEFEQVHLATRLALAWELTSGERHLVVLDDVLTATDDARMGRILEIIGEWRERMQFLILTCHPERYRPLNSARFIDLAKAQ
jgi:DNA repair exonuclease SbcCD ATPase subunit